VTGVRRRGKKLRDIFVYFFAAQGAVLVARQDALAQAQRNAR
jgi:hypothetical protein